MILNTIAVLLTLNLAALITIGVIVREKLDEIRSQMWRPNG